jgi:hypothetical protein
MGAIRKVTSIYFWQLMEEQGRAHACEVVSRDSLLCKPSYKWKPSVFVSTEWVMVYPTIDNPPSCENHAVIRFPHSKNTSAAEIRNELCSTIYGQSVKSEGTVRQWCRMLKMGGWTNVRDAVKSVAGHVQWVMILFQVLTKKFVKDGAFVWISTNFKHSSLWGCNT